MATKSLSPAWFILCAAGTGFAQSTSSIQVEPIGRIPAEPDVVLEWNAAISDHFDEYSLGSTSHIQARVYALAHMAMRDAAGAAIRESRIHSADADAKQAAGAAAHEILTALCPSGVSRFAAVHARQAASFAKESTRAEGERIGRMIAASLLSSRAGDGWPIALAQSQESTTKRGGRSKGAPPTPFMLKKIQEVRPEPPFFVFSDGTVRANRKLQTKNPIGSPADARLKLRAVVPWSTEPVLQWNRAAWSHAVHHPQTLLERVRLFAALNMALADALLSATYWNEVYRQDRGDASLGSAIHEYHRMIEEGNPLPDRSMLSWMTEALRGFPPTSAVLAGAAETILRSNFDEAVLVNVRVLARQCAWSPLVNGSSSAESCIAGYELGSRIGALAQKRGS